jgi:hypothetical protein
LIIIGIVSSWYTIRRVLEAKIIIEQNMDGKLSVENLKDGVVFSIAITLYEGISE